MKTVLEILKESRELLSDENRWCREAHARDVDGLEVDALNEGAVSWCIIGSLVRSSGESHLALPAMRVMSELTDGAGSIPDMNDEEFNHADVLQLFDEAIAKCETANG